VQDYPLKKSTKEIMTLWYRAPEVILDNLEYTASIDLWSAGVIIFEMLTGQYMFQGNSEIDMLFKIFHLKGTPKQTSF
jgi:cyclin-dependent kinase